MINLDIQYKTIIIKKHKDGCSEIILNQPEKHNTLSPLMIEELNDIFDKIDFKKYNKIVMIGFFKSLVKKFENESEFLSGLILFGS